jgi:hypothetical protein
MIPTAILDDLFPGTVQSTGALLQNLYILILQDETHNCMIIKEIGQG